MADEWIKRKDLLRQIDKVSLEDWLKAAQTVGLVVTQPTKGSSHYAIRRPGFEPEDFNGFITVVYEHMHKQDKPKVFRQLRQVGIEEDDLWLALGFKVK